MTFKAILFFASLLIQNIYGLYPNLNCGCGCLGNLPGLQLPLGLLSPGLLPPGVTSSGVIPTGFGGSEVVTNLGGDLVYSCISPLSPYGVSITSALEMAGPVLAQGVMPFFSAVAFESLIPTACSGTVAYGCGDSFVGIEDIGGGLNGIGPIGGIGVRGIGCGLGGIGGVGGYGFGGFNGGCGCL